MMMHRVVLLSVAVSAAAVLGACRDQKNGGEGEKSESFKPTIAEVSKDKDGKALEGANDKKIDRAASDKAELNLIQTLNPLVLSESRALVRDYELIQRTLTTTETAVALRAIREARDIAAGRGPTSNILCLPSSSKPGLACMKSVTGDNTCIGNYFTSIPLCKTSLSTSRNGRACYQSSSQPGKALISLIAPSSLLIGNYYSNINNCTTAMAGSYGSLVCMESARFAGKWFIANLDQNAAQVGGYFNTFAECQAVF